ncbi:MAG: hypothetical protein H6862_02325 [Rhodospirillales bacterium]|nr:hypothetical protein [Rhodospirillales bacterium]
MTQNAAKMTPEARKKPPNPRFLSPGSDSALPFEELCAAIATSKQTGKPRDLMFTAPAPGVGTSTVARNFAEKLAASGEKVLLLQIKQGSTNAGPEECAPPIRTADDLLPLVHQDPVQGNLSIITLDSGRLLAPTAHNGEALSHLLDALRGRYESVIWDMPPLDIAPLSGIIAHSVMGVVLVVHAGHTRWHAARHHAQRLRYAGGTLIGVVLNRKKTYIPGWIYRFLFR